MPYLVHTAASVRVEGSDAHTDISRLEQGLNSLEEEGWLLIHVTPDKEYIFHQHDMTDANFLEDAEESQ